jgi:ribosomal-protein-alanine N-acetyltransferase
MTVIPTLTTPRLKLRPFARSDAAVWWQLLQGTEVLRYFPPTAPVTQEMAADTVARMMGHWDEHGYGLWAVELMGSGAMAGRCGLQFLAETDSIEIDYVFGQDYWGRGYATEAAQASARYAFETLGAEKLTGIAHVDNLASHRVLEKIGMKRLRAARFFGIDCFEYGLVRESNPSQAAERAGP